MLGAFIYRVMAYLPIPRIPRSNPTRGQPGRSLCAFAARAQDILLDAGAGIVNLADSCGPEVHVSTLHQAVVEDVAGKRID